MSFKLKTYIGDFEWNNGEEKPTQKCYIKGNYITNNENGEKVIEDLIDSIVSFSANGEELKAIQSKFQWIPSTTDGTVTIWRGGWATFIYENL